MSVKKNSAKIVSTWIITAGITLMVSGLIIALALNSFPLPLSAGITIGAFLGLTGTIALSVNNDITRRATTRSLLTQN